MGDRFPHRLLSGKRLVGPGGRTTELTANEWTPAEAERRITAEVVEWMYIFDPQGRQIARFRGTVAEVDLSDELTLRTRGLYSGSVLKDYLIVHNHPRTAAVSSFPPSPSDLCLTIERDLRQFVVVSGKTRYVVRRIGHAWPLDEDLIQQLIRDIRRELAVSPGEVDEALHVRVARQQTVLERLHRDGWIDYEQSEQTGNA